MGVRKDGGISSVEGLYSETPALGRVTPRAGEEFTEVPGLGNPGNGLGPLPERVWPPGPRAAS